MKRQVPWIIGLSFLLMVSGLSASTFYSAKKTVPSLALSTLNIDTTIDSDAEVNDYYSSVNGLIGPSLQSGLYDIIKTANAMTYEETSYAMKITDRNWSLSPLSANETVNYNLMKSGSDDPYLNLLYGQYNDSTSTAYKWSADHTAVWNKEHIWAKSHGNFLENIPAGTDLHHLRAADQNNNILHNNYDYGFVTQNISLVTDERGNLSGKLGPNALYSGDYVFEPRNEDKGDIARAIFYMATRYYQYLNVGAPKLEIIEGLSGSSAITASLTVNGRMGILSSLLAWNALDPVSPFEIRRNNLIDHNFQGNRNPYIDHPEWVNAAFDEAYSGYAASTSSGTSSVGGYQEATLTGIFLETASATTSYWNENNIFSTSGLIVMANYSDGSSRQVNTFNTNPVQGTILTTQGQQAIEVSYTENGLTFNATYDIQLTVTAPQIQSILLNTNLIQTTFVLGETFNYSGLGVIAVFDTGNQTLANGVYAVSQPNMYSLGEQTVSVSYSGKSSTYLIIITNAGASVGEGSMPENPTWYHATVQGSDLCASQTVPLSFNTLSGIKWNYSFVWATPTVYIKLASVNKGIQIGTATNYASSFIMETDQSFSLNHIEDVLKVGVEASGASGTNASLKVSIGGTSLGSNPLQYLSGTDYFTLSFNNTNALSGKIKIEFTQTTGKAIYLHGINIYGATFSGGITPKQQASAFASYVLGLPACTMTDEDVITMISEYDSMTAESKEFFNASTNGETLGKDRYDYILYLHPNAVSLSDGDFIPLEDVSVSNAPLWLIFVILPFAVMAATGVFIFIRRKYLLK